MELDQNPQVQAEMIILSTRQYAIMPVEAKATDS